MTFIFLFFIFFKIKKWISVSRTGHSKSIYAIGRKNIGLLSFFVSVLLYCEDIPYCGFPQCGFPQYPLRWFSTCNTLISGDHFFPLAHFFLGHLQCFLFLTNVTDENKNLNNFGFVRSVWVVLAELNLQGGEGKSKWFRKLLGVLVLKGNGWSWSTTR